MKRPSSPGPRYRADTHVDIDPPLSLRDIVEALCSGFPPGQSALEATLDRIEGGRR
ncbi:hypothetical protein AXZ77_3216 [Thioclava sp. ES.031]|uniref:DUF2795 domain-containing protein n=1 Tax=Thioclava electrotropha TaxID=1549850 RepID=A0ABX6YX54_9RHOB|nr:MULTISPECIES: hypothetical protein [Thioclava]PFG64575.1 hypothetical protein AXZ77_3216 [Thioclava sp. ES.031]QPZ92311.1 hypothetical protein AKL02_016365 [Thioclava electrotropha]|tara:strand:+ start:482 stop:649 length:168 start_codon:yes stop_codon:yes gene_type:complete